MSTSQLNGSYRLTTDAGNKIVLNNGAFTSGNYTQPEILSPFAVMAFVANDQNNRAIFAIANDGSNLYQVDQGGGFHIWERLDD